MSVRGATHVARRVVWASLSLFALCASCSSSPGDTPPGDAARDAREAGDADAGAGGDVHDDEETDASTDGGGCSIVGAFTLGYGGGDSAIRFLADGTYHAGAVATFDSIPSVSGKYTLDGARITMVDDARAGGSCEPEEVGEYEIRFEVDCGMFWTPLKIDPCYVRQVEFSGGFIPRP